MNQWNFNFIQLLGICSILVLFVAFYFFGGNTPKTVWILVFCCAFVFMSMVSGNLFHPWDSLMERCVYNQALNLFLPRLLLHIHSIYSVDSNFRISILSQLLCFACNNIYAICFISLHKSLPLFKQISFDVRVWDSINGQGFLFWNYSAGFSHSGKVFNHNHDLQVPPTYCNAYYSNVS